MRRFSSKEVLSFQGPASDLEELHSQQHKHSLLALLELSHDLSFQSDIYGIAETSVLNFMGHVGTRRVALWMFSESEDRRLVLLRAQGVPKRLELALGEVMSSELIEAFDEQPYPLGGEQLSERLSASGATVVGDAQIALVVPLITRGRLLGMLALGDAKGMGKLGYSASVIEILRSSSSIVASALDSSWRHSSMVENNRQLRAAYDELQELDSMKSDFLSTLDHELKTPLTLLSTYLLSFQDSGSWTPHQLEWLRILNEQVGRLDQLIAELLDWKSLAEETGVELECARLDDLAREFYEERKPGVAALFRRLTLKIDPMLPPVQLNREGVLQILDVLLDNAQKFTPQGTHISIRVTSRDERVELQMTDDGPGIAADRLNVIFDAFRQVEPALTRTHGGIGIGLAMARKLAECMNGQLTASSQPGKETTLTLALDAVEQRRAA